MKPARRLLTIVCVLATGLLDQFYRDSIVPERSAGVPWFVGLGAMAARDQSE